MMDTTFKPGDRVELHPALDDWMRGDRFGEVVDVTWSRKFHKTTVHVRLDRSGRVRRYGVDALVEV